MQTVGYLGPEGSYSHLAAKYMCGGAKLNAYASFSQVFSSLVSGRTDAIVVPIENSLNGGVLQNMDLLQSTPGVYACGQYTLKIDHRLVTVNGADKNKIKRIYSHSQALEQCARYLYENFPSAELIPAPSTAASLDMLKTEEDAAIAGSHTVKAGFTLSDNNIADGDGNFTHFLLVKKGDVPENSRSQRIYFSVTCKNRAGALLDLLGCISRKGLNMTKIESRPIKNVPDEYRFFVEIDGDYSSEDVKGAIENIKLNSNSFKLLGCY